MYLARSPLRISIGGGGTDLPSYYERFGSSFVSVAIRKYVYVNVVRPFEKGIYLKYSNSEFVRNLNDIKHGIIRESLRELDPFVESMEITTLADIPSGTGLGSSGCFGVAMIAALAKDLGINLTRQEIAELACRIEMENLGLPTGKQDQYTSAFGGLNEYVIDVQGAVTVKPLVLPNHFLEKLEKALVLFFTGYSRSAASILEDQDSKSKISDSSMIDRLHHTQELGNNIKASLLNGDLCSFGNLMNEHWESKVKRSENISNTTINEWYRRGLDNGAIGGKLVGAGGGGFLLFVAEDPERLKAEMNRVGLREVPVEFDHHGLIVNPI